MHPSLWKISSQPSGSLASPQLKGTCAANESRLKQGEPFLVIHSPKVRPPTIRASPGPGVKDRDFAESWWCSGEFRQVWGLGNQVGPRTADRSVGRNNQDKYSVYSGYIMIIHDISIVG